MTWRWRAAIVIWIVASSVLVAIILNHQHRDTVRAQRVAAETKAQNAKQQRVLVSLCNRGYVSLGVIDTLTAALPHRYQNDLSVYRNVLVNELTAPGSPCVSVTR